MFEPKSVDINRKVHETGKENNFGDYYWIGVKGNKYVSDGSQILINPPWLDDNHKKIDNCLVYCNINVGLLGKWCDFSCRFHRYNSVCEHA